MRITKARSFLALAISGLALALALSACGSGSSSQNAGSGSKPKKIFAFVFAPRGFNDVTRAWFNGFDDAARQLGPRFTVTTKAPGRLEPDAGAYLNLIRQSLAQQPDGIVVVPNNAAGMKAGLEQIARQTKVVVMDQDVPDMAGKVSFVGTDNRSAGRVAASWLVRQHRDGRLRSNQVGILRSRPGISSTDERYQGFVDRLKGTGLRVASTLSPSCDDSAAARSATADMLSANPDLGGLFSVCDVIALGAARALQGAGKLDVQHVSIDASKDGVGLIVSNGGIDAEVAQHLRRAGRESVLVLARALQGQQVDKRIDTGTELVTKENAQAYLRRAAQDSK